MSQEENGHVAYLGSDGKRLVPFSLVVATHNSKDWQAGERMIFIEEIKNLPGHCLVVNQYGKLFPTCNTDDFRTE